MMTLFIELSKVKYSRSEHSATHISKTKLKTAKSQKPSKIKGFGHAYLHGRRSHVAESKIGDFSIL